VIGGESERPAVIGGRNSPSVSKLLVGGGGQTRLSAIVAAISGVLYWQFVYLFYLDRRMTNLMVRLILQPVSERDIGKEMKRDF